MGLLWPERFEGVRIGGQADVGQGGGVGSISMNRPSHHKYKSPKQFLLIPYLKTSGLNSSKRILCKLGPTSLSRF